MSEENPEISKEQKSLIIWYAQKGQDNDIQDNDISKLFKKQFFRIAQCVKSRNFTWFPCMQIARN